MTVSEKTLTHFSDDRVMNFSVDTFAFLSLVEARKRLRPSRTFRRVFSVDWTAADHRQAHADLGKIVYRY
jgi:hypothetical protein